jgi:hypothetical protein
MLKLINGTKKAPRFTQDQLAKKHYNMSMEGLKAYKSDHDDRWALRKATYNIVRYCIYRYHSLQSYGEKTCQAMFGMQELAKNMLFQLTPREFIQDFPPRKTYDGERYQCADFFSSWEQLSPLDLDTPFHAQTNDLVDLLWGYQNRWILMYLTSLFSMVSKLREYNGESGLLAGFCEEQGIEPPQTIRVYKDQSGKKYAVDSSGKAMPLRKAKPRYLRIVK